MRVIAIQGVNSPEPQQAGDGWRDDGTMFTLNTRDQHMIALLPMEPSVRDAVEQLSIFSSAELPASPSPSQASAKAWQIRVATSPSPGAVGRTSPVSCQQTTEGRWAPSLEGWGSSGMGSPIECWTLNTSDWPSDGSACSLSAILETGAVPQRFYLSARACQGILRRAERRGKKLPIPLQAALEAVAATVPKPSAQ
jgi:hypothetical protein